MNASGNCPISNLILHYGPLAGPRVTWPRRNRPPYSPYAGRHRGQSVPAGPSVVYTGLISCDDINTHSFVKCSKRRGLFNIHSEHCDHKALIPGRPRVITVPGRLRHRSPRLIRSAIFMAAPRLFRHSLAIDFFIIRAPATRDGSESPSARIRMSPPSENTKNHGYS